MNTATQQTETTEAPLTEVVEDDFDARIAAAHEQARAEREQKAKETPQEDAEPKVTPAEPPVAAADEDEASRERRERHERLASLTASERKADAKRQERVQRERTSQEASELEKLRARVAELEPLESAFKDETSLLMAARQRKMNPVRFAEVFKEAFTNPEFLTEHKVNAATSIVEQRIAAAEKRLDEKLAQIEAQSQSLAADAAEREATEELVAMTAERARLAPLAAAFLTKHGPEAYAHYAVQVAQSLPPGCGLDRVHDAIETFLERVQLGDSPTPSSTKSKSPPVAAAKARPTVTNQLASTRATVDDDDEDFADLPFEERLERVKKS